MKIQAILVLFVLLLSMGSVAVNDVSGHRAEVNLGADRDSVTIDQLLDPNMFKDYPKIYLPRWSGSNPSGTAYAVVFRDKQYYYVHINFVSDTSKDQQDGAWIYIDTKHTGADKPQVTDQAFGIQWFGDPIKQETYISRGTGAAWVGDFFPPGLPQPEGYIGAAKITKNMVYGFRIPRSVIGENEVIGIAIAARDGAAESPTLLMVWPRNASKNNPMTWGDIIFSKEPTAREKISSTFNSEQCVLDGKWTTKTEYEKSLKISMKDTAGNNVNVFIRHNDESICIILHWLAKKVVYGAEVVSIYFDIENNIASMPDKDDISFSYLFIDEKKGKVFMENSTGISWGEDYDYSMIAMHSDDISNSPYKDRHYMVEFKISWTKDLRGYKSAMGFEIANGGNYPRTTTVARFPDTATRADPRTWAELTFPKEQVTTTVTTEKPGTTISPPTTTVQTTPTKAPDKVPEPAIDITIVSVVVLGAFATIAIYFLGTRKRRTS